MFPRANPYNPPIVDFSNPEKRPAKRLITEYNDLFDQEFKALYKASIKTIREGY
jgi:hypothetical protein